MFDSPFFLQLIIILAIPIGYYIIQRLNEVADLRNEIKNLQKRVDSLEERLLNAILFSCIAPTSREKDTASEEKKEPSDTPADSATTPKENIVVPQDLLARPEPTLTRKEILASETIPCSSPEGKSTEKESDSQTNKTDLLPSRSQRETISPDASAPLSMEYFVGSKLLSWVGGFTLFLGLIFFVKYSIENNLISPVLRIILTYLSGFLLLGAGLFIRKFSAYSVLSYTLQATGILVLYLGTYAGKLFYDFPFYTTGVTVTFLTATTVLALYMASRYHSHVIAVLGVAGGFITPYFLATGTDNTVTLFLYISLLNTGLAGIIVLRKWAYLAWIGILASALVTFVWTFLFGVEPHGLAYLIFTAYITALYLIAAFRISSGDQNHESTCLWALSAGICLLFLSALFTPESLNMSWLVKENIPGLLCFAIFPLIPLTATWFLCRRYPLASPFFPIAALLNVISYLSLFAALNNIAPELNRLFPRLSLIFLISFGLLGIIHLSFSYTIWKKTESIPLRFLFLLLPITFISTLLLLGYSDNGFSTPDSRYSVCLASLGLYALASFLLSLKEGKGSFLLISLLAFAPYCYNRPIPAAIAATAFFLFPLCFQSRFKNAFVPWFTSAISLLFLYPVLRHNLLLSYPGTDSWLPGMIALVSSFPLAGAALLLQKKKEAEFPLRKSALTIFWAFFLGFITLSVGEFFEKEWLTIALALEGTALLWLNQKLPARWLVPTGMFFLSTVFTRLIMNPYIITYHQASDTFLWNWYLYTYGIAFLSCQAGARILRRNTASTNTFRTSLLNAQSGILLFALTNLEIANTFSPPDSRYLAISFGNSLACDLTYSIAWGLFAMGLLILGLVKRSRTTRITGLALLGITLLKLFLYDLSALEQMFRIAALIILSVIILLSSILYQKYIASEKKRALQNPTPPPIPPAN